MPLLPLQNISWGFDTHCFVCESTNDRGLRIPFFHDTDAATVRCTFSLSDAYSGAPQLVHGGIVLAVLDEAMAWANIAVARRFALTKETKARFRRTVHVDQTYHVIARVVEQDGRRLRTRAELFGDDDRLRVWAEATFAVLSQVGAAAAIGDITPEALAYLRPEPDGDDGDGDPERGALDRQL